MRWERVAQFEASLEELEKSEGGRIVVVNPTAGTEEDLLRFHTREYVEFVKRSSDRGDGCLDEGDTPAFKGVYEASLVPVGSTVNGVRLVLDGRLDHFFNPVGGLHHSRPDRAAGFCVFNDAAIAICELLEKLSGRVAYVDIDAHHGDGVFYAFESDPRVTIGDVHQDGHSLYPGTGGEDEMGTELARGTKLNVPLQPGSGDDEFRVAFDRVVEFLRRLHPDFVLFQCGADGLDGDPIAQLRYSAASHRYAAHRLHELAHDACEGRILALGGGGYNPANVSAAWTEVTKALSEER